MWELGPQTAVPYLIAAGRLPPATTATSRLLEGGVSNVVVRVAAATGDMVLKQSRIQLRTRAEWRSRLERIWREADVLRMLEAVLPAGAAPRLLFEDRQNYLLAMEAVDADHVVWKESLLAGRTSPSIAARLGQLLAAVHGNSGGRPELETLLGDTSIFDELRLDPYYRWVAAAHPSLQPALTDLVTQTLARRECLVLADFSPKNILVTGSSLSLVDFETGHCGDPAFDIGFFLSHILLKGVHLQRQWDEFVGMAAAFWTAYGESRRAIGEERHAAYTDLTDLERRSVRHLAACLLARIDGKSPVDYLTPAEQNRVRSATLPLIASPPATLGDLQDQLADSFADDRGE